MERVGKMSLAVDFGDGRQADVELEGSEQLWIAAGPELGVIDVWLKPRGAMINLRVRIRRTDTGIEVIVDRGDGPRQWWSADAAPRLEIGVDLAGRSASAIAAVGVGANFQQVLLGHTMI